MKFEVGSTILLDVTPEDDVVVTSHGIAMFSGKLGQVNDKIAAHRGSPDWLPIHVQTLPGLGPEPNRHGRPPPGLTGRDLGGLGVYIT